jgi:hypothetical protein
MALLTFTSGYLPHTEFKSVYGRQTTTNESVTGFGILCRPQPENSREDSKNGYNQQCTIKYNDSGGTSFTRNHITDFPDSDVSFEQSGDGANTSFSSPLSMSAKTNGSKVQFESGSGIDLRVDIGTVRSFYTGTASLNTAHIDAIVLQRVQDDPSFEFIETTGVKKSGGGAYEWTPYDENESCSSYVMKELAVNNTLIINNKSAEKRTYPLFRPHGS